MNLGLPVTISNDDPTIYGYTGLSYDYFEGFISWNLTLSDLKQLTKNSLEYSALNSDDKNNQLNIWRQKWNDWIQWVVQNFNLNKRREKN